MLEDWLNFLHEKEIREIDNRIEQIDWIIDKILNDEKYMAITALEHWQNDLRTERNLILLRQKEEKEKMAKLEEKMLSSKDK